MYLAEQEMEGEAVEMRSRLRRWQAAPDSAPWPDRGVHQLAFNDLDVITQVDKAAVAPYAYGPYEH